MIEALQLTKRYGAVTAVDRLDLMVEGPGVLGFLGPNGAGKTTTMRMLTGFVAMSSGTARVCGYDVFESPLEVKERVGYLPEAPPLYPELTVGEYLRFVAEIRGLVGRSASSRIGEVMERTGLTRWERRLLSSLSKGYRQRVALAQAIVHRPALLILDEPTSGLDPIQRSAVRSLIRELAVGTTVVVSTHALAEVEALCDRIVLLHGGRLVGDGTVDSLGAEVGAGPWVEFELEGVHSGVSACVAALPAVSTVERTGPTRFRVTGTEGLVPELVSCAAQQGWRVQRLQQHGASLEEVFLRLVGEES